MEEPHASPGLGRSRRFLLAVFCLGLFPLLFEGLASLTLALSELWSSRPAAERLHTRYDAELGWVNRANVDLPDLYGPGLALRTNAQGFRNDGPIAPEIAPGKVRILCAGDSFTLGYGVDQSDTWVAQLESLDPRLETVNLGQGGYGVDQAYLAYERVRGELDHDLFVLAFITFDFQRTQNALASGILRWGAGAPFERSHPRPEKRFLPGLRREFDPASLASVRLLRSWFADGEGEAPRRIARPQETADFVAELVGRAVAGLPPGARLVLVHLPMGSDHQGGGSQDWRTFLATLAKGADWSYVDLVPALRALPGGQAQRLFLQPGEVDHPGAAGHFNARGNRFVAEALWKALREEAEVSRILEGADTR